MQSVSDAMPGQVTHSGRLKRFLAYLYSPKVLIGGILAFIATESVEAYKTHRTETRADVVEVREQVLKIVLPSPETSAAAQRAIDNVTALLTLYDSEVARDVLLRAIGSLSELRAALLDKEAKAAAAQEAQRVALEAKAQVDAAAAAAATAQAATAKAREVQAVKQADRAALDVVKSVKRVLKF